MYNTQICNGMFLEARLKYAPLLLSQFPRLHPSWKKWTLRTRCTTTSGPIWGTLPRPRTLPSSSLNVVPNRTLINTNRRRQTNSKLSSCNRWAAVSWCYWGSGGSSIRESVNFSSVPRERCSLFLMLKWFPTLPAGSDQSGLRVWCIHCCHVLLLLSSLTLLLGTLCVTSLD